MGAVVGATVATVAVNTDQYGFVIEAAQTIRPTSVPPPVSDTCRNFTAVRPDGSVSETRVVASPHIDGAITSAAHSTQTVDDPTSKTRAVDQYLYVARLDDHHLIIVTSFANPVDTTAAELEAEHLLTEAIDGVRS
jgi:hypothetical protein